MTALRDLQATASRLCGQAAQDKATAETIYENAIARASRFDQLESSPTMIMRTVVQLHNRTFNVQRHLTSARTHRAFRASAMQAWREAALRPGSERIKYANEAPQKLRKRLARGRSGRRWPFRGKLFRLRLRATASLARPRSGRPSIPAHSRKSSIHYAPELCNKKGF